MKLLVDTSVWSLAFRRDREQTAPEVTALREALLNRGHVFTTGIVVQELLQGLSGPKDRDRLLDRLAALEVVHPDLRDHVEAVEVRNACRQRDVQVGTIDALLIQLCRRHDLVLLTTDQDFRAARTHLEFALWPAA